MTNIFYKVNEILNQPFIAFMLLIFLVILGVDLLIRLFKAFKQPLPKLYEKENLYLLSSSLHIAIDGYREHFSDEELNYSEEYKEVVKLSEYIESLIKECK